MVRSSILSSKFSLWEGWEHLTFIKEIISSPSRSADIRYLGSWVRKIPWRRELQPTPVFLPEEFHGQRSLVSYSPRCCKESDMTEQLTHTGSFLLLPGSRMELLPKWGAVCSMQGPRKSGIWGPHPSWSTTHIWPMASSLAPWLTRSSVPESLPPCSWFSFVKFWELMGGDCGRKEESDWNAGLREAIAWGRRRKFQQRGESSPHIRWEQQENQVPARWTVGCVPSGVGMPDVLRWSLWSFWSQEDIVSGSVPPDSKEHSGMAGWGHRPGDSAEREFQARLTLSCRDPSWECLRPECSGWACLLFPHSSAVALPASPIHR